MPCAGANHDGHPRMNINDLIVQLHLGVGPTLQEVVGLRQPPVMMQLGISGDLRDVDGRREIFHLGKSSSGCTTRAGHSRNRAEVGNLVSSLR